MKIIETGLQRNLFLEVNKIREDVSFSLIAWGYGDGDSYNDYAAIPIGEFTKAMAIIIQNPVVGKIEMKDASGRGALQIELTCPEGIKFFFPHTSLSFICEDYYSDNPLREQKKYCSSEKCPLNRIISFYSSLSP